MTGVRLDQKVCVVTGASGGIGAATVELFKREGARVAGADLAEGAPGDLSLRVDVTDEEQVRGMYETVVAELGDGAFAAACDLRDPDALPRFLADAADHLGPVDVFNPQAIGKPIDSGHFLAEENPHATATALLDFFTA